MIRKLILALVSILALYLTYDTVVNGMSFAHLFSNGLNALPFKEIEAQGSVLDNKLQKVNSLNNSEIVLARSNVQAEITNFEAKRQEYALLEASASADEIAEANKEQEYLLDYLWIVIGNYANDNNVKFKMTTDDVNLRINFDITGSYVSIINFIYDIENDENLKFNLNGIELAQNTGSSDSTKASFSVDGVTVKTAVPVNN